MNNFMNFILFIVLYLMSYSTFYFILKRLGAEKLNSKKLELKLFIFFSIIAFYAIIVKKVDTLNLSNLINICIHSILLGVSISIIPFTLPVPKKREFN